MATYSVTVSGTSFAVSIAGVGQQGAPGANWQGAWATTTDYAVNDVVSNDGSAYICILAHTSASTDEPGVGVNTATYWAILAQGGADGTDGDGFTGGSYNAGTGVVTFTSDDGLGFSTGDLRGADGTGFTGGTYNAGTGVVTFTSEDGIGFSTGDIRGEQGDAGWSPILVVATDGERRVLQVDDWTGGEGTKPATGDYVGAAGLVADIANAVDIRGPQGATGETGLTGDQGLTGDTGATGDKGWSPILVVATDGARRVLRVNDWAGGEGTKPAVGDYVGPAGLVSVIGDAVDIRGPVGATGDQGDQGIQGETGLTGDTGATGDKGWSPVFSIVSDGARRVLQVSDWTGGEGTKPATGDYVGPTGLVALIASAIDIRGPEGASGSGTGDMLAATYDPQNIAGDAFARASHTGTQAISTVTGLQAALDGKAASSHTHTKSDISDFSDADYATAAQGALADSAVQPADIGTAAPLNVAATGDAGVGEVVKGDDTRLSDSRDPTAHTHTLSDISDAGTAAANDASDFATAAQGALADSAQQPPAEGAFVDGDKTKLDGIEAGADVTDTANVTAAGALMDSEVTNLAAVKSFDPADYATAAQGTTADSALQSADIATASQIRAATSGKLVSADGIPAALALTTPSGSTNFAPDFNTFMVADWNITANRTLLNPTNVAPGETRYVFVRGSSTTPRTVSFGSNYKGALPTLDDVTTTKWYLLSLVAYSSTHIVVASVEALS